jgi:hypothetical protein
VIAVLLVATFGVAAAPVESLELRLAVAAAEPASVPVVVEVTGAEDEVLERLETRAPGRVALSSVPPAGARLTVAAPGWWARPQELLGSPSGSELNVTLWPATEVRGRVRVPEQSPHPVSIGLRVASAAAQPVAPREAAKLEATTLVCPVADDGSFRCAAPALPLADLRVRVPGFASRFFWGVDLREEPARDLGLMRLRPGASVVGRVELPPRTSFDDVTLVLDAARRSPFGAAPAETLERLEAHPDPRGFFAFEGLSAGAYRLVARHPDLAPQFVEPVRVVEGAQTELTEVIVLAHGEPLRLAIEPAFDADAGDWIVRIFARSGQIGRGTDPVAEENTTGGFLEVAGLAPGEYEAEVLDSGRQHRATTMVEHRPGGGIVTLTVETVRVTGTVRLGDEPLLARLTFRGTPVQVRMESDLDGRFVGVLPRDGEWDVEVEAFAPPVRWRRRDVRVVAQGGEAALALDLPDERVEGVVVDEKGTPHPDARVSLDQPLTGREVGVLSDAEGRFVFYGLTEGTYEVQARAAEELGSAPERVEVRRDTTPELRLVLRRRLQLVGRVLDAAGNVLPGVWVQSEPFLATGAVDGANAEGTSTDAVGRFRFDLAPGTARVHLAVMAPGFALRQMLLEPGDAGDLVVRPEGGTLLVEVPPDIAWLDPSEPRPFLLDARGNALPIGPLISWSNLNGVAVDAASGLITIPLLEPGTYRVCWMTAADVAFRGASGSGCQGGDLQAGGALRVRLAPADAATARGPA